MNPDLSPELSVSSAALSFAKKSALVEINPQGVLSLFLSGGRNAWTRNAYQKDLKDFTAFTHQETPLGAVALLLTPDPGAARGLVMSYLEHLRERQLSPATCNRRLASLSSLVKLAKFVGLVSYELSIERRPEETLKDTRGPGKDGVRLLLEALKERGDDPKARRDAALIRLMFDLALRRNEALSLDIEHINLKQRTVLILGKGRGGRQRMSLPESTCEALKEWLKVREELTGTKEGPLFVSVDYAARGKRLTGTGLHKVLSMLGKKIGLKVRPHGLRHASITAALDATGGDVRKVQKFSRHKSLQVLCVYDDCRLDHAGEVANLVAL
jgi:integrase/recombinase XerC